MGDTTESFLNCVADQQTIGPLCYQILSDFLVNEKSWSDAIARQNNPVKVIESHLRWAIKNALKSHIAELEAENERMRSALQQNAIPHDHWRGSGR